MRSPRFGLFGWGVCALALCGALAGCGPEGPAVPAVDMARGDMSVDVPDMSVEQTPDMVVVQDMRLDEDMAADMPVDMSDPEDMAADMPDMPEDEDMSGDMAVDPGGARIEVTGSEPGCPRGLGGAVYTFPLKTLRLIGSGSSLQAGGKVARYVWTIVERPADSTTQLMPGNTAPDPSLFLDVAGVYRVRLRVEDAQGKPHPDEAEVVIHAQFCAQENIHVELVWQTPADAAPFTAPNADLDLHYLEEGPGHGWGQSPHDAWAQNPSPDWDFVGEPRDNPVHRSAALQESIVHAVNNSSSTYRIGVHLQDDAQFGASYATVRVFVRGALAFEQSHKYLDHSGAFWDVARVSWPSGAVTRVNRLYSQMPAQP